DLGFDEVTPGVAPFATFTTTSRIKTRGDERRIVVQGKLALAPGASIAPTSELVTVTLSDGAGLSFQHQPPPESFVRLGSRERYASRTSAGDAVVDVELTALRPLGSYRFKLRARGASLPGLPAGVLTVTLRVGDDAGEDTAACRVGAA